MKRLAAAALIASTCSGLAACGSSQHPASATSGAAETSTSVASGGATTTASGRDGRCADAVAQSVAPPSGQWPTPSGYLVYSRSAHAVSVALRSSTGPAGLAVAARQADRAAAQYRKASAQPSGSANNPYTVARAALDLQAAAHLATAAGLPACGKALQRLALDASGTLGQPAKAGSCGSGNVPVLGGCVEKKLL